MTDKEALYLCRLRQAEERISGSGEKHFVLRIFVGQPSRRVVDNSFCQAVLRIHPEWIHRERTCLTYKTKRKP